MAAVPAPARHCKGAASACSCVRVTPAYPSSSARPRATTCRRRPPTPPAESVQPPMRADEDDNPRPAGQAASPAHLSCEGAAASGRGHLAHQAHPEASRPAHMPRRSHVVRPRARPANAPTRRLVRCGMPMGDG
jgi:hypothetical protein